MPSMGTEIKGRRHACSEKKFDRCCRGIFKVFNYKFKLVKHFENVDMYHVSKGQTSAPLLGLGLVPRSVDAEDTRRLLLAGS